MVLNARFMLAAVAMGLLSLAGCHSSDAPDYNHGTVDPAQMSAQQKTEKDAKDGLMRAAQSDPTLKKPDGTFPGSDTATNSAQTPPPAH